jgi:hypothetical protein
VLRESLRILRQGGKLSLFEPVLAEEELGVDWGDEIYLWTKLRNILAENHPAYGFNRSRIVDEVGEAGYENVESFIWHADVTRPFAGEEEAMEELRSGLPGELSLAACWFGHGALEEEVRRVAQRLALESVKPSYRDTLPCVFVWGRKP